MINFSINKPLNNKMINNFKVYKISKDFEYIRNNFFLIFIKN